MRVWVAAASFCHSSQCPGQASANHQIFILLVLTRGHRSSVLCWPLGRAHEEENLVLTPQRHSHTGCSTWTTWGDNYRGGESRVSWEHVQEYKLRLRRLAGGSETCSARSKVGGGGQEKSTLGNTHEGWRPKRGPLENAQAALLLGAPPSQSTGVLAVHNSSWPPPLQAWQVRKGATCHKGCRPWASR